jgi:hypothetical protein
MVTPSMNSLIGIVRNLAWPLTGSWSCAIVLISNPVNSPPKPSICVLAQFAGSHTKQPTAVFLGADLAAGSCRVKGVKKLGVRLGNWLTAEQGNALWQAPDRQRLKGKRGRAVLALPLAWPAGCPASLVNPYHRRKLESARFVVSHRVAANGVVVRCVERFRRSPSPDVLLRMLTRCCVC